MAAAAPGRSGAGPEEGDTIMASTPDAFAALVLDRQDGNVTAEVRTLSRDDLPPGEVLVETAYSSVNYKDALAVTDRGRIVSSYPIVPGIDLAGTVVESETAEASPGDEVIVCGRGIGEVHPGGFARYQRVHEEWLIARPPEMSSKRAMVAGTAGYTAMLSVMILEDQGLEPGDGEVVVTGATGGVGSFAVAILAHLGHEVVAVTGRPEHRDYLARLGAADIVPRETLSEPPSRPMVSARWAGAVDCVGGATLASLVASMRRHATIAACGVAGGPDVHTTVYPFILRGVNLMGVDSNYASRRRRQEAFDRLASQVPDAAYDAVLHDVVPLAGVPAACTDLLEGRVRGRVVVELA